MALVVSTRVLGKRKPLLDDFSIPPPDAFRDGDDVRLRDVIEHVVRHEVARFNQRQEARRFDRVLTRSQIETQAARGKVDPAAKQHIQHAEAEEAVGDALQAFEDGMYLVIIDEVERRSLDEVVRLNEDSRLAFVRLAFLAGA